ncbi:hypothetical protein ACIQ6R_00925 [Streptomyces sp. NPDC096048]|uniref:hypothetical protein n=1 Tax=Streptomyces sp. NPDC096048 TaxID=3366072 RepID=UPI00382B4EE4
MTVIDGEDANTYHVTSDYVNVIYEGPKRSQRRATITGSAAIAGAVIATLAVGLTTESRTSKEASDPANLDALVGVAVVFGLFSALALSFSIPWFITRRKYMKNQNEHFAERIKAERERHQQAMEQLKKTTELATLMGLNQGQIKTYHDIVTEQADKSFKSSRTAMNVGLLLLVAAAVGGVYVPIEEIRWFIGALALFSTVFSAYLSRTYLLLYRESISQLNRYFDQPVLNSFYLTAERLTSGLDVEHAQTVRQQIIDQVLETSTRIGDKSSPKPQKQNPETLRPKPRKPKKPKKQSVPVNGTRRS